MPGVFWRLRFNAPSSSPSVHTESNSNMSNLVTIAGPDGPICNLKENGRVEWEKSYNVDDAADAFAEALTIGTQYHAGITKQFRKDTIANIYSDLLELVDKRGGSLTKEDLTKDLEQRIIVNRLKGL